MRTAAFFLLSLLSAGLVAPQKMRADEPNDALPDEFSALPESSVTFSAHTKSNAPGWAKFASTTGNVTLLASGVLLPLILDGKEGKQHSLRAADALLTSVVVSASLKRLTHERRPDDSNTDSFPSGHTMAAFAVATTQAHYHPKQAWLWYGGAAAIGASRVALDKHYWHDVVAGAALGYFTAQLEQKQKHGILLRPFIRSAGAHEGVTGLALSRSF